MCRELKVSVDVTTTWKRRFSKMQREFKHFPTKRQWTQKEIKVLTGTNTYQGRRKHHSVTWGKCAFEKNPFCTYMTRGTSKPKNSWKLHPSPDAKGCSYWREQGTTRRARGSLPHKTACHHRCWTRLRGYPAQHKKPARSHVTQQQRCSAQSSCFIIPRHFCASGFVQQRGIKPARGGFHFISEHGRTWELSCTTQPPTYTWLVFYRIFKESLFFPSKKPICDS